MLKLCDARLPMEGTGISLAKAVVLEEQPDHFLVQTSGACVRACQAVSCLVRPRAGDMVLLSLEDAHAAYILSILKRDPEGSARTDLVFAGEVKIRVEGGGLSMASDANIALACPEELSCAASRLSLHADEGEAKIEKISFVGRFLQTHFQAVRAVAETVDHVFKRLTQCLEESSRFIKGHEEVQSRSSRHLAEETLTLHSKNAVHMAEEIVTINAQQIHLG